MAVYIGYFTTNEGYGHDVDSRVRGGEWKPAPGEYPEPVRTKARELPSHLPPGCKVIGSYIPLGGMTRKGGPSGITIVETDDPMHLAWFNYYYGALLDYRWEQYMSVARHQDEQRG